MDVPLFRRSSPEQLRNEQQYDDIPSEPDASTAFGRYQDAFAWDPAAEVRSILGIRCTTKGATSPHIIRRRFELVYTVSNTPENLGVNQEIGFANTS